MALKHLCTLLSFLIASISAITIATHSTLLFTYPCSIHIPIVPEVPFVNDTIVGDPLLNVPLTNTNFDSLDLNVPEGPPSLCFEIHGEANEYFNLVTDDCVTVNARYNALNVYWNVINRIGVKAVDDEGKCREISVDLEGCAAAVDNVALTSSYSSAGIFVRPYRRHVRVSVPNCNGSSHLAMYVFCQQNLTVWDPFTDEPFQASMIKYVIAHGINLNENSHGLIGKFVLPLLCSVMCMCIMIY